MDEITEKVVEVAVKEVSMELYKDVFKPSIEVVGELLSFLPRTVKVLSFPCEKWLLSREHNINQFKACLEEELKDVENKNLVLPEPQIAVEVIDAVGVCADSDYLRKMYAKLLAASMKLDTRAAVHPSYVEIIKQLTPDEAKILEYVWINNDASFTEVSVSGIVEFPIEKDIKTIKGDNLAIVMETLQSYFENLERLQLIRIRSENNSITWNNLSSFPSINHYDNNDYDNKHITMTIFGNKFCFTCIGR